MKYIVILGDGMADEPVNKLGGKTPLDVAVKPNIDYCASKGSCGMVKTIPEGMKPGSDVANLAVMGYSPRECYTGRAPLEALSIGAPLQDGDMAIRCNLVTLSSERKFANKTMVDYSAGEISDYEAKELIQAVNKEFGNHNFSFYPGVSYRNCLISHINKESFMELTPPHDISDKRIGDYLPKDNQLAEMVRRSFDILDNHPINRDRRSRGKNPANAIWLWGTGTKPKLENFKNVFGLKGAVISAVDLLKGIAIGSGMTVIDVEGATGKLDTNYNGKAKACVKALVEDGFDYVYLHVEAPDECSHQGDVSGKVTAIEKIDSEIVAYIREHLKEDYTMLIMPDHATPLNCRTHTVDSVPFIIYRSNTEIESGVGSYNETDCAKSGMSYDDCDELIKEFLFKDIRLDDAADEASTATSPVINNDGNANESDNMESDGITEIIPIIVADDSADNGEFILPEKIAEVDENEKVEDGLFEDGFVDPDTVTDSMDQEVSALEPNAEEAIIDDVSKKTKQKKQKESKHKKTLTKEQKKKRIIIWIIVAVFAVAIIVTSIVTPILILNKDKIFVNDAADFDKVDKGTYYVLEKDILVEGDLAIANPYSIDLQGHQLKVTGSLVFSHAQDNILLNIGTKKGKEYISGGIVEAKEIKFNCTGEVNVTSNIKADVITMDKTNKSTFADAVSVNNRLSITNGDNLFKGSIAFGTEATFDIGVSDTGTAVANNISVVIMGNAQTDINFLGAEGFKSNFVQGANTTINNITMNQLVDARIHGNVINNVIGGKKVIMTELSSAKLVTGMSELWMNDDNDNILCIELPSDITVNYIINLATPQDIQVDLTATGEVICSVNKVNNAARYSFRVGEVEKIIDASAEKDGMITCDLTDIVTAVGDHKIFVTALGAADSDPDLIRPSKPIFTIYTHNIKLDKPQALAISKDETGIFLSWGDVRFADEYIININGISIEYRDKAIEGRHSVNITEHLKNVGGYSIRIQAKCASNTAVKASDMAMTSYEIKAKHEGELLLTYEIKDGRLILSWNEIDTAKKYTLYRRDVNGNVSQYILPTNAKILEMSEYNSGDIFYVKANEIGYYLDSKMSEEITII